MMNIKLMIIDDNSKAGNAFELSSLLLLMNSSPCISFTTFLLRVHRENENCKLSYCVVIENLEKFIAI